MSWGATPVPLTQVAFAFCRLLGFQLLPRLKAYGTFRLDMSKRLAIDQDAITA
jgi:TnpA family transposase